jgi:hypothetical protein
MKWLYWIGGFLLLKSLNKVHSATKFDFSVRGLSWHESFSKLSVLLSVYNPSSIPAVITSGLIHVTCQEIEIGLIKIDKPINITTNGFTNVSVDCYPSFLNVVVGIYNLVIKQKLSKFKFKFTGSANITVSNTVNTTLPIDVEYLMDVSEWK